MLLGQLALEPLQYSTTSHIPVEALHCVPAGSKSQLVYDMNGRRVEMIETILKSDFPDEFSATYEAKGVMNWVYNRFYDEVPEKTRWELETEFKFSGMMRLMGVFMRSSFPKETLDGMNRFKEFAENA